MEEEEEDFIMENDIQKENSPKERACPHFLFDS